MKLKKHFITLLVIGLALGLPHLTQAQTYTLDGIQYTVTSGTDVQISGTDPSATSLIIRKNPVYNNITYTTGKIENGMVVSDVATTVTFDGPWALETDISGTQFYNLTAVEKYIVTNPNTTFGQDPSGEHRAQLRAGDDGILFMWHSDNSIHMLAYPCKKTDLTEYTVPANVTNIQASTFRNNETLTTINLNEETSLIRNEAFAGCKNLTTINAGTNPNFLTVNGVLFQINIRKNHDLESFFPQDADYVKTLTAYPAGKTETSYEVPSDVVVLGRSCFYGATNLQTVTFAPGTQLEEIREFAFNDCYNLTNLKIPASVQYINMKYYDSPINPIGSGVQTGTGTYNSHGINAATILGAFTDCHKLVLDVDADNPYFKVINTYNGGKLLSNVLVSKDETRLIRYGCTTDFPGYIVPRTVTWIDAFAFNATKVKHVVLPSMITDISRNIFDDATQLEFITIPPLVTNIRQDVFRGCTSLSQVFMMPEVPPTLANANVFDSSNPTIYVKPNKTVNNSNNGNANITINIRSDYASKANYPSTRIATDIPVTLNAYGLTTMCRDFAVELGDKLQAYYLTNETGVPHSPSEELQFLTTNIANTAGNQARFIPARTGENYGDYRGVVLKAVDGTSAPYTYQISVEDFANNFNLRGINKAEAAGYHANASYTFPDKEFETNAEQNGTDIAGTNCTVTFEKIGYTTNLSNIVTAVLDGKYYHKLNNAEGAYITIKLNEGAFQAGDKFKATLYTGSADTDGFRFKTTAGNNKTITFDTGKENTLEYTLTADDINTDGSLTVYRYNARCFVRNIQVVCGVQSNQKPRTIKESQYIIGTPVETNVTVYDGDFTNFGLKGGEFRRIAADGILPCNKAYMHLPNVTIPGKVPGSAVLSSAKFAMLFAVDTFMDDTTLEGSQTTGIQSVKVNGSKFASDYNVYNLQGRKVGDDSSLQHGTLPKGLYILNGKKYIVK